MNDDAALLSHILPALQQRCLTFWYNMYGDGIGNLKVYLQDMCKNGQREMFKVSGDQGQSWKQAVISIPVSSVPNDYKIKIVADVGPTYHGDISIDDVIISTKTCSDLTQGGVSMIGNYTFFFSIIRYQAISLQNPTELSGQS
ncbi:MAM and LDL-receptor class A domain-containing protein 1-like isoform X1 [Mercenaria mercenaria]|uniref:MAM and LDL-receptor class A domain-containing protein 1-like isoform X1 n=2 Tax=Mercenaria mercenaria TaxID=6596 RepID=UPI00234E6484|nr:MAM and LDL-receptor class A domain-containing protein 1-like isoform X1 [Mercenaria mercenaria]